MPMNRFYRIISLILLLALATVVSAQTSSGQICVRAFEDRNSNGLEDQNEPRITRGLSATLANAQGVIIASTSMEESPNASNGTLCFQRLEAGQYTVRIASADYSATTPTEFISAVSATGTQPLFVYGAQLVVSDVPASVDSAVLSESEQRARLSRLIFSAIGAVVVIAAMAIVGAIIYLVAFRNRGTAQPQPITPNYAKPATGGYPAVRTPAQPVPAVNYSMYDDKDKTNPPAAPTIDIDSGLQPSIVSTWGTNEGDSSLLDIPPHLPYDDVQDDGFRFDDDGDALFRPPNE